MQNSSPEQGNERRCSHSFKVYCTLWRSWGSLDLSAKSTGTTPRSPLGRLVLRLVLTSLRSSPPFNRLYPRGRATPATATTGSYSFEHEYCLLDAFAFSFQLRKHSCNIHSDHHLTAGFLRAFVFNTTQALITASSTERSGSGMRRDAENGQSRDRLRFRFTPLKLMTVIVIAASLMSIGIPIYSRSIVRGKERVLKNNLFTLRTVIHEYTWDKQKAPLSLNDLVSDRYLRQIPVDPITGKADWKVIRKDHSNTVNQSEAGIFDVRSVSDKISLEATPYSAW
jgi:general secretion pathway protein G